MPKRYRDYALPLLLFAGCGLLLVALLSEWAYHRNRQAELKARLAEKVEVRLQAPTVGQERYELPGLDIYAATVERPLFMESRRPAVEDASQPETVNVVKAPLNLKLMGVLTAPDQAVGLFVDSKGKYKRLRKNETMAGWKVAELEPGKAVMEQDGTREELKVFKPKDKKKPGPPAPVQPPAGQIPGQPIPQPPGGFPGQPVPVPGAVNLEPPPIPMEPEQPNSDVPLDETAVPPEEPANDQ